MSARNWVDPLGDRSGALGTLGSQLTRLELREPGSIPNLRMGRTLLLGSDYSGQHRGSEYEVLGFIITDSAALASWLGQRQQWRADTRMVRRISYKGLNDRVARRHIGKYLSLSNSLNGMLITIAFHKSVISLFNESGKLDLSDPYYSALRGWRLDQAERVARIIHLIALLVAGLSAPGQDVLWITDEDSIASNERQLEELTSLSSTVMSNLSRHDMGRYYCGTTSSDRGDLELEDFVSLADLAAGAICDGLNRGMMAKAGMGSLIIPGPKSMTDRAKGIVNWLANDAVSLKKHTCVISEDTDGVLQLSWLKLHRLSYLGEQSEPGKWGRLR